MIPEIDQYFAGWIIICLVSLFLIINMGIVWLSLAWALKLVLIKYCRLTHRFFKNNYFPEEEIYSKEYIANLSKNKMGQNQGNKETLKTSVEDEEQKTKVENGFKQHMK